jgi:hypothetical protein
MTALGSVHFGEIRINRDSFAKRFGRGTHQETEWEELWRHSKDNVFFACRQLERLADVDIEISALDPDKFMSTVTHKETGQAITVHSTDTNTRGLFALQARSRTTNEYIGDPFFVEPKRNDFEGLRRFLFKYISRLERPINSDWLMGERLQEAMSLSPSFTTREKWFMDIFKQILKLQTVNLSFLPLYERVQTAQAGGANYITEVQHEVVGNATALDWLQYLWSGLPFIVRQQLLENLEANKGRIN